MKYFNLRVYHVLLAVAILVLLCSCDRSAEKASDEGETIAEEGASVGEVAETAQNAAQSGDVDAYGLDNENADLAEPTNLEQMIQANQELTRANRELLQLNRGLEKQAASTDRELLSWRKRAITAENAQQQLKQAYEVSKTRLDFLEKKSKEPKLCTVHPDDEDSLMRYARQLEDRNNELERMFQQKMTIEKDNAYLRGEIARVRSVNLGEDRAWEALRQKLRLARSEVEVCRTELSERDKKVSKMSRKTDSLGETLGECKAQIEEQLQACKAQISDAVAMYEQDEASRKDDQLRKQQEIVANCKSAEDAIAKQAQIDLAQEKEKSEVISVSLNQCQADLKEWREKGNQAAKECPQEKPEHAEDLAKLKDLKEKVAVQEAELARCSDDAKAIDLLKDTQFEDCQKELDIVREDMRRLEEQHSRLEEENKLLSLAQTGAESESSAKGVDGQSNAGACPETEQLQKELLRLRNEILIRDEQREITCERQQLE